MSGPKNAIAARRPKAAEGADGVIATSPMIAIRGELNSGRPCVVSVPADISDAEVLSLIDGVLRIRDQLAKNRRSGPRLLVPS